MSVGSIEAVQQSRGWAAQGACVSEDPDDFFVSGAEQNRAKIVCRDCPVRNLCLADALDNRIEFGVWGGMTERERRRLAREYPHVKQWLPLLEKSEVMDRAVKKKSGTGPRAVSRSGRVRVGTGRLAALAK